MEHRRTSQPPVVQITHAVLAKNHHIHPTNYKIHTDYNPIRSQNRRHRYGLCDEYSQEVLGFSNVIASGNPTPCSEPIVSTASPTLTPFGDSDFLLFEEADSFLALEDDPTSSEVDPTYQELRKSSKLEAKTVDLRDEPPELNSKERATHLEYAF
ncbi:hypothetical protein Tco_1368087 [Tanacetum coccineum]